MDIVKYLSIPYMDKGRDEKGADCYGFVRLILKNEKNIELPIFTNITTLNEFKACLNQFKPTLNPINFDIVLMKGSSRFITHVGLFYDNHVIHLNESGASFVPLIRLKPIIINYYHPEITT